MKFSKENAQCNPENGQELPGAECSGPRKAESAMVGPDLKSPLACALSYAERGYHVLPLHGIDESGACACGSADCESPGKRPSTLNGLKDATVDPEVIRDWFLDETETNLGIRTGKQSGITVLDIDGPEGEASLAKLIKEHGNLPTTVEAKTGRGRHLYFEYCPGLTNRAGICPGLDLRNDNGYVVAPPSRHVNGGAYVWASGKAPGELPFASIPGWLLETLRSRKGSATEASVQLDASSLRRIALLDAAERYQLSVEAAPQGERNTTAFSLSGHLAALDADGERLDEKSILNMVARWNDRNEDPLSSGELAHAVHSALRNGTPREKKPVFVGINRSPRIDSESRAEIQLVPGQHHAALDEIDALFAKLDPPVLYERGGAVVRITSQQIKADGTLADIGQSIQPLGVAGIIDEIGRKVRFIHLGRKAAEVDVPKSIGEGYLSRAGIRSIPILEGVVYAPQLLADGRVIEKPGYDKDARLYFDPRGTTFPPVPSMPTRENALEAMNRLQQLISGFPFVTDTDRSAALSAILTGVCRRAVPECPMFVATAPVQSSGKSTFMSLPAILATGQYPSTISLGDREEETEKRLFAALMGGMSHVNFDNMESALKSPSLCKTITEPNFTGRLLGASNLITLSTRGVFFSATGNNIDVAGDLITRCVAIRLDTQEEEPWKRQWKGPCPKSLALQNRGELVVDCITILRAYLVAGRPNVQLSGFRLKAWSNLIRSALVWLALPDPLGGMEDLQARDPEIDLLDSLMQAWRRRFGSKVIILADAVEIANETPDLEQAMIAVAPGAMGGVNNLKLGKYLSKHRDRRVNGRIFRRVTSGARATWQLVLERDSVEGSEGLEGEMQLISDGDGSTISKEAANDPLIPVNPHFDGDFGDVMIGNPLAGEPSPYDGEVTP